MVVAYVAQISPQQYRGRYMGLLTVTWSFGMVFGPPIGTLLFAHNEIILWLSCGLLGIFAASLLMAQARRQTVTS
jgi:MFS family permease